MGASKAKVAAALWLLGLVVLALVADAKETDFCRQQRKECQERCGKHADMVSGACRAAQTAVIIACRSRRRRESKPFGTLLTILLCDFQEFDCSDNGEGARASSCSCVSSGGETGARSSASASTHAGPKPTESSATK